MGSRGSARRCAVTTSRVYRGFRTGVDRTPLAVTDGTIMWPKYTDKMGKKWRCPILKPVREALEAARHKRAQILGWVGPRPLFPSPGAQERALRYEEASAWLRNAETKADRKSVV